MACFLVPTTEAIASAIAAKVVKSSEKKDTAGKVKIPFSRKLGWLRNLSLGGSVLLAFEHLWHGEIVPWFPFLTAAADPADAAAMLHEMATVGVAMAVLITAVWGVMCLVADSFARKENKKKALQNGGAA